MKDNDRTSVSALYRASTIRMLQETRDLMMLSFPGTWSKNLSKPLDAEGASASEAAGTVAGDSLLNERLAAAEAPSFLVAEEKKDQQHQQHQQHIPKEAAHSGAPVPEANLNRKFKDATNEQAEAGHSLSHSSRRKVQQILIPHATLPRRAPAVVFGVERAGQEGIHSQTTTPQAGWARQMLLDSSVTYSSGPSGVVDSLEHKQ